jgi:hypothetical protein
MKKLFMILVLAFLIYLLIMAMLGVVRILNGSQVRHVFHLEQVLNN